MAMLHDEGRIEYLKRMQGNGYLEEERREKRIQYRKHPCTRWEDKELLKDLKEKESRNSFLMDLCYLNFGVLAILAEAVFYSDLTNPTAGAISFGLNSLINLGVAGIVKGNNRSIPQKINDLEYFLEE